MQSLLASLNQLNTACLLLLDALLEGFDAASEGFGGLLLFFESLFEVSDLAVGPLDILDQGFEFPLIRFQRALHALFGSENIFKLLFDVFHFLKLSVELLHFLVGLYLPLDDLHRQLIHLGRLLLDEAFQVGDLGLKLLRPEDVDEGEVVDLLAEELIFVGAFVDLLRLLLHELLVFNDALLELVACELDLLRLLLALREGLLQL